MSSPFARKFSYKDWLHLLTSHVSPKRMRGVRKFIREWMDPLGFRDLPGSCYYHGSEPGGLVDHCTRVGWIALNVSAPFGHEFSKESVALCGALHDLNKLGFLTDKGPLPRYLKNEKFDPSKPVDKRNNAPYVYNPKIPELPSTHWITMVASTWLPLSFAEWKAICFHDGQYVPENVAVFQTHNAEPLLLTIAYADMMALAIEKGISLGLNNDMRMVRPKAGG